MPRRTRRQNARRQNRVQPAQWHDPMVDMLINERRRRNDDYHNLYGRSRQDFWHSVARRFICTIFYFIYIFIEVS
jgi:hypothetical protein